MDFLLHIFWGLCYATQSRGWGRYCNVCAKTGHYNRNPAPFASAQKEWGLIVGPQLLDFSCRAPLVMLQLWGYFITTFFPPLIYIPAGRFFPSGMRTPMRL